MGEKEEAPGRNEEEIAVHLGDGGANPAEFCLEENAHEKSSRRRRRICFCISIPLVQKVGGGSALTKRLLSSPWSSLTILSADHRRDLWYVLRRLRRLRIGDCQPQQGDDHLPRRLHRVGPGGHGHGLLRRPHLRRALQSRRHPRLRHQRALPLERGTAARLLPFRLAACDLHPPEV